MEMMISTTRPPVCNLIRKNKRKCMEPIRRRITSNSTMLDLIDVVPRLQQLKPENSLTNHHSTWYEEMRLGSDCEESSTAISTPSGGSCSRSPSPNDINHILSSSPVSNHNNLDIISNKKDWQQTTSKFVNPFRPWIDCHKSLINPKAAILTSSSSLVQEEPLELVVDKKARGLVDEQRSKFRNYKNMTPERRMEANARERNRVHAITAAFERLQEVIPHGIETRQESDSKKTLSKLAVIKVSISYIMLLSRMMGYDYSIDQSCPSVSSCVQKCLELIEHSSKSTK